jgi:hypothetical protein
VSLPPPGIRAAGLGFELTLRRFFYPFWVLSIGLAVGARCSRRHESTIPHAQPRSASETSGFKGGLSMWTASSTRAARRGRSPAPAKRLRNVPALLARRRGGAAGFFASTSILLGNNSRITNAISRSRRMFSVASNGIRACELPQRASHVTRLFANLRILASACCGVRAHIRDRVLSRLAANASAAGGSQVWGRHASFLLFPLPMRTKHVQCPDCIVRDRME